MRRMLNYNSKDIFTGPSIPPWLVDAGPSSVSEKAFLCVLLSIECGLFVFFRLWRLWLMLSGLMMIGWCSFRAPLREATQSPLCTSLSIHAPFFHSLDPRVSDSEDQSSAPHKSRQDMRLEFKVVQSQPKDKIQKTKQN